MKLTFKKMASLLLTVLIILGILSGCSGSKNKGSSNVNPKGENDNSPITLTAYVDGNWSNMDNWGNDPTSKRITKETGVTVKTSKPVANDTQKVSLMVSSGDLPDYMILSKNDPAWDQMIANDQLFPLDELMDKYAPKMKSTLQPEHLQINKYKDGKIYYFANFVEGPKYREDAKKYNSLVGTNQSVILIRQDYYDEIGKPEIKNPQDFMKALEELKAKHPDKIPFYGGDGSFLSGPGPLTTHFGIEPYYKVDDTLKMQYKDPKYLDMLKWMNQMASNGLLTKESFVDNTEISIGKTKQGLPISYTWTIGETGKIPSDNPKTTYQPMAPWDSYKQVRYGTGWYAVGITKKCKNPARAIRFLEYANSEAGWKAFNWGVEGDKYSGDPVNGPHYKVIDGKPTYFKEYMDAKLADWAGLERKNGLGAYSMFVLDYEANYIATWNPDDPLMKKMNEIYAPKVVYTPEYDIVVPGGSDESVIDQKIDDLIKEYTVKIVFAKSQNEVTSLYNEFVNTCEKAGASKLEKFYTETWKAKLSKNN
ncbi:MAG TPA: hypothetical protein DD426_05125 [Clostridiaceae bacterium]|nr:hypothetical protein [Clostridiaceae bacterium]